MGGTRFLLLASALALGTSAQAQIAFRAASQAASASGAGPTYVASATATANAASMAIAQPAGAAQDDVLIAQVTVKGVQAITAPTPAGSWTLVNLTSTSTAGNQTTQAVYWRRVGVIGSEPASYTWSWSSSDRASGAISAYRSVDPNGSPIDVSGVQSGNNAASMTLPTLTTTQPNAMLVALLGSSRATNAHDVATGMTVERYEATSGAGPNGVTSSLDEQAQAAAGSTGAKTATMGTSTDYVAHLLALRSAGPLSISVPAGTVAGDIMVATVAARPCTAAAAPCTFTIDTPTGWTLVNTIDQTSGGSVGNRLAIYWRAATAADPGASYTWTFGGTPAHTGAAVGIVSFLGVDTTSPIVAQSGQATASGYPHVAPTIDTGSETDTMLVSSHAANASGSWTSPGGMTEQVDVASLTLTNAAGISLQINSEPRAAAGATGTRTATLSNPPVGNTGTTHMLALRAALSHYAISGAATTVANCDYAQITIVGHNTSHTPTNVPSGRTVTLSTSTGTGVWQAGLVAGTGTWLPSGLNNGSATYTWPGGESGFTIRLRQSAVTSLSVNVSDGTVTEAGTEDPTLSFVNSVFRISNGSNAPLAVGTQIAGKPSDTGFGSQSLYLQAVRTDTATGACVSLFPSGSDVSVEVGAQCNNPATCTQNLSLTSSALSGNTRSFVPNGTYAGSMNFRFTTANAEAPFSLNYADAGQLTLQFRAALPAPPAGQFVQGTSNAFVTRPFGFAFPGVTHATTAGATPLATAGDNFSLSVGAYRWAAAHDANNDGIPDAGAGIDITANGVTPNFAATTTLTATGNLPGVSNGSITRATGGSNIAAGEWSNGTATLANWRYSEVGNVFLGVSSDNYLGDAAADISGNSGLDGSGAAGGYIGRFRPKQFAVSAASVANRSALACGGTWSYMDEGFRLIFTLTAQNAQNGTTQNYTGGYATLGLTNFSNWSLGARDGTTNLTPRLVGISSTGSWSDGVAANVAVTTAIQRAAAGPDGPFTAVQFGIAPTSESAGMDTLDFDADNNSVNERKNLGAGANTEVRFGRLRMENAVGSEKLPLPIQMETQYWTGTATGFRRNDDSCTSVARQNFTFDPYTGNLNACETIANPANATFAGGVATINLSAPGAGNDGTVLLTLNVGTASGNRCDAVGGPGPAATSAAMSYLLGRWSSGTWTDNPSSRAAFGLYGGQPNSFIYFRENY